MMRSHFLPMKPPRSSTADLTPGSIWQHQETKIKDPAMRCKSLWQKKNGKLLQHVATPACDDQQDVETQQDNQKPVQGLAEEEFHQTTTARLQIHIHIWKQVHHFGKLGKMSLKWCTGGHGWSRCQVGAKTFAEWCAATKMARLLCNLIQFDTNPTLYVGSSNLLCSFLEAIRDQA